MTYSMDQHLQVFVTVAEKQNFSRAAETLHMTQPAVSQYIRIFEESFGVRLLERTNKYVHLNKAGEIVYHHAKEIIGLYNRKIGRASCRERAEHAVRGERRTGEQI